MAKKVEESSVAQENWEPLEIEDASKADKKYLRMLDHPLIQSRMQVIAEYLTAKEGPVSPVRLAKFMGSCFSSERVTAARTAEIGAITFEGLARDSEGFLYPRDATPESYLGWRGGTLELHRDAAFISLPELANALLDALNSMEAPTAADLKTETAWKFGLDARGPNTEFRLTQAIDLLIEQGRLDIDGEMLRSVPQ